MVFMVTFKYQVLRHGPFAKVANLQLLQPEASQCMLLALLMTI